jgi:sporulation protein YlmC with PRC-barrel domain
MISVENIEAWRGQKVIDPAGEDLGKVEDVFFDVGSGTPLLVSVKTGLLGRKSKLVPIDGASVAPNHVRVAHSKDVFDRADEMHGDGAPGGDELAAIGSAYGLRFADRVQLQSATERDRLRQEAEAARARAEQLEAEAEARLAAHEEARQRVEMAGSDAGQTERDAEAARQAALQARQEADRYGNV